MNLVPCECEHISHVDPHKRTPNGNPAHDYGVMFYDHFVVEVSTPYGTFKVCKDCSDDCYSKFKS